ncbi:MAG: DUF4833 domain-containing protein [Bacteroidales bacterium]|nr:DUF4833 domain-containing protein [Bacteroidales bacterium]
MKKVIILLIVSFGFLSYSIKGYPGYTVPPKTKKLLFYIQRNHNRNTIVYDAIFDKSGNLDKKNPINVYWIRYQEYGQTMPLRTIEKLFAYGVKSSKIKGKQNEYKINLVATDKRDFLLKQEAPFKAAIYTKINEKPAKLGHLYIFADNSGFWPKVKYIELFGKDTTTGKRVYEKMLTDQ